MHELAVTENILEIAKKHGIKAGAKKVTDIYLVIGQLSSIIDDSVQFYWDMISLDTICEGAKLHFRRISTRIKCLNCGNEYVIKKEFTPCPVCASSKVNILAGDEFYLESIEITKDQKE
jgi:hydrogenase nickel incorporation protein HypA/HybF